jgi:hypothetical protein
MFRSKYSLVFVGMLTACGGGSGSDSTTNNNNNNNQNNSAQNTLSVQVVYQDACGNETFASDSALLVHNSDYSNKATLYADNNGQISYQTDEDNITISLIARGQNDVNGVNPISVTTIIDQPVIDKGIFKHYTRESSSCECITPRFDVFAPARTGERAETSVSGYFGGGFIQERSSYSSVSGYEFCKAVDEEWPLMSVSSTFSNPNESYGLLTNDLSLPSYDATLVGTPINIVSDAPNRQVSSYINGEYLFFNYSYFENTPLFGFDTEQTEFYRVESYDFFDIYDVPDVDFAYLFTIDYHYSNDLNQTFNVTLPVIDYTRLFDIILSENGRYDLSDIQGLDYIATSVIGYDNFQEVFNWYLIAPVSGNVPQVDNIDISEFISDSELESSINSMIINAAAQNYKGINGYQDYQTKVVGRELSDFVKPEWNKKQLMSFNIQTSNVEFTSLRNVLPTKALLQSSVKGKSEKVTRLPKMLSR